MLCGYEAGGGRETRPACAGLRGLVRSAGSALGLRAGNTQNTRLILKRGVCPFTGVCMSDIDLATVYTKKTAAVRLNISVRQVNRLIEEGHLAYSRKGRKEFIITEAAIRACEDTCPTGAPPLSTTPRKDHPWRTSPLGANSKTQFSPWELKSMFGELKRYEQEGIKGPRRAWLQATVYSLRSGFRAGNRPAQN